AATRPRPELPEIPPADLRPAIDRGGLMHVVDVRTPAEFRGGHVDHAVNIPAGEIPARAGELPRDAPIVAICEGGYRSSLAASLLAQEGIAPLANVTGGMAAYRAAKEVTTRHSTC